MVTATSLAQQLAVVAPNVLNELSAEELVRIEYDWKFWGRPNQFEPEAFANGSFQIWLIMTGRGFGKNRTASETINDRVERNIIKDIAIVAPTAADARDIIVEGDSGIVTRSKPWFKAKFIPSKRRVEWPNGAKGIIYSAEDPEQLRGHNSDFAYCDELAAWNHLTIQATWDNLMFGLRLGCAQAIVTTTPRPIKLVRELLANKKSVFVTRGTTYENLANLSPTFRDQVVKKYEGTRLGRQELNAEILDDTPGALWSLENLDANRVTQAPPLKRIGVSVDPAGSRDGHEIGITVGGISYAGEGFLLEDASMHGTPDQWGNRVVDMYNKWEADIVIVENNFGGEMVSNVIHNIAPHIPVKEVRATRGKQIRAEPVSMLNERNLIHHVGSFNELEDQLTTWLAEEGPNDRLDSYVWLWTELLPSQVRGRIWFI